MNLGEYQLAARKTAIYPEQYRIAYPGFGLIGEGWELTEKLNLRFTVDSIETLKDGIIKEAGDICWYCANLCLDLGINLDELYIFKKKCDIQDFNFSDLAEVIKKILRDGSNEAKISIIKNYIAEVISNIAALAIVFDTTLEYILETNIKKLASRQERDKLHGEGDNR